MDEDVFERLSSINDELLELCGWVNQRLDAATAERLVPIVDKLTRLVAELSIENGC
jgi:hypothetical protein